MDTTDNRRTEERLGYQWPVWFGRDFTEVVSQGLMVDISSGGIAFTCQNDESCPCVGQRLVTRFSIPRPDADDDSGVTSITRTGHVCGVKQISVSVRRVAIRFEEPLSLKPCELASIELMQRNNQPL